MSTECYSLVRGSALRVTGLTKRGALPDPLVYAVSKSVVKVTIDEVSEAGANEILRNADEEKRLHLVTPTQTIRYTAAIEFLRVDPGLLSLVTGVPVVANAAGDLVGFDADTKIPAASFALEVWSKLASDPCRRPAGFGEGPAGFGEGPFGEMPFGEGSLFTIDLPKRYGYTLFPFLKGGILTGFKFDNGLVSFNLVKAQTRRGSDWGSGPYPVESEWQGLYEPVSRNAYWRSQIVGGLPPVETDGAVGWLDEIDGGTASMTTSDEIDGGTAWSAGSFEIDGGAA